MSRTRAIICASVITLAPFGIATANAAGTTDTTLPPAPDSTYVYDLDREPDDCIGFLPRPGCGKKPEQAGDRGGSLQYLTFGFMIVGLATIGTVLVRNVMKRDRAMSEAIKEPEN